MANFSIIIQSSVIPSLPATDQSGSRLLTSPPEIRKIILGYLLTSPEAVHQGRKTVHRRLDEKAALAYKDLGWNGMTTKARTVRKTPKSVIGIDCDPQLLRTCQKLLREGFTLLYSSNRLGITVGADFWRISNVAGSSIFWSADCQDIYVGSLSPEMKRFVSYFGSYEVKVKPLLNDEKFSTAATRMSLRELANTFVSKDIHVRWEDIVCNACEDCKYCPNEDAYLHLIEEEWIGFYDSWIKDFVCSISIIRCKNLTFEDKGIFDDKLEQLTRKVQKIVKSQKTIIDSMVAKDNAALENGTSLWFRGHNDTNKKDCPRCKGAGRFECEEDTIYFHTKHGRDWLRTAFY